MLAVPSAAAASWGVHPRPRRSPGCILPRVAAGRLLSASPATSSCHVRPLASRRVSRRPTCHAADAAGGAADPSKDAAIEVGDRPDHRVRADIAIGSEVDVVRKADQGTGTTSRGVVREFLTNSRQHPQGIKVRLVDGTIGRVQRVLLPGETGGSGSNPGGGGERGSGGGEVTRPSSRAPGRNDAPTEDGCAPNVGLPGGVGEVRPTAEGGSSDGGGGDIKTVYLSNVPKVLNKSDVLWLVEEIPGVRRSGLRLPKRGGKNMGYAFIQCDDAAAAAAVIETLDGMELEGRKLVAAPAKEETRDEKKGETKRAEKKGDEKKGRRGRGKSKTARGTSTKDEEEEEEEEDDAELDPIAKARAEMEAEAILELERARRAARRRMEEAEAKAREQREREAKAEARTTAMLLERRKRAEEAAAKAARERAAEEALRQEALDLGPPKVDAEWAVEMEALGAELAALRSRVE